MGRRQSGNDPNPDGLKIPDMIHERPEHNHTGSQSSVGRALLGSVHGAKSRKDMPQILELEEIELYRSALNVHVVQGVIDAHPKIAH